VNSAVHNAPHQGSTTGGVEPIQALFLYITPQVLENIELLRGKMGQN
jgi:hypothetical protein